MHTDIKEIQNKLPATLAFVAKYGHALRESEAYLHVASCTLNVVNASDVALYGEVFGRDGWVRHMPYGCGESFNWIKTVDGIEITLIHAEEFKLNDTPVPEKAFPLQLTNVS